MDSELGRDGLILSFEQVKWRRDGIFESLKVSCALAKETKAVGDFLGDRWEIRKERLSGNWKKPENGGLKNILV